MVCGNGERNGSIMSLVFDEVAQEKGMEDLKLFRLVRIVRVLRLLKRSILFRPVPVPSRPVEADWNPEPRLIESLSCSSPLLFLPSLLPSCPIPCTRSFVRDRFESLQKIMKALKQAFIPVINSLFVLVLFTAVYACLATHLFRHRCDRYFGSFARSMFTMIQVRDKVT